MEDVDKAIEDLMSNGCSIRDVARQLRIGYGKCRSRALKLGLFEPNLKKAVDGKADCTKCKQNFPLSDFPNLLGNGRYLCRSCSQEQIHEYQIKQLGCTKEQYDELFVSQDGKCAICGKDHGHVTCLGRTAKLAVDHDHETGRIRGLLCGNCNRGLGYLGQNNIQAALVYCAKC